MAVRMRLKRFGRTHHSFFRLSVMDARKPRDGRVIEELGHYDPHAKKDEDVVNFNRERVEYWLSVGAEPTDTVAKLLKQQGIGK